MYIPDEGIKFVLNPGPRKDDEGRPVLYAIPVPGRKLSFEAVAEESIERGLTHRGSMEGVFSAFLELAGLLLSRGYRVETPIGSFAPKLTTKGDFTSADDVKPGDVEFGGIEFRPSKQFLKVAAANHHRPQRQRPLPGLQRPSATVPPEQALAECMTQGYTTVRTFMYRSDMKRDAARHFLDSQCAGDQPLLKKRRVGQANIYTYAQPPKADQ